MDVTRSIDVFPLNSSVLSGTGTSSGYDEIPSGQTTGVAVRNLVIGSLGIVSNSMAFVLVLKSKKVTRGRKVLLLNLLVSHAVILFTACIYSADASIHNIEGNGCLPITAFIIISILSSYLLAFLMSAVTFLAVYQPFRYRSLRMVHYGGATASTWVLSVGISSGCVALNKYLPGRVCVPVVVVSTEGLFILAIFTLLSFLGVMLLNIAVVLKVRKGLAPMVRATFNPRTNYSNSGRGLNLTWIGRRNSQPQSRLESNIVDAASLPSRVRKNRVTPEQSPPEGGSFSLENPNDVVVCPSQIFAREHRARQCEFVPRAAMPLAIIQIRPRPSEQGPPTTFLPRPCGTANTTSSGSPRPHNNSLPLLEDQETSTDPSSTSHTHGTPAVSSHQHNILPHLRDGETPTAQYSRRAHTTSFLPRLHNPLPPRGTDIVRSPLSHASSHFGYSHSSPGDKVCKTLLVLTTYTCVISLPLVLYLICIASSVIENPERLLWTPLGIFLSSCPITNACINPFFYVLHFTNWRHVIDKIRKRR